MKECIWKCVHIYELGCLVRRVFCQWIGAGTAHLPVGDPARDSARDRRLHHLSSEWIKVGSSIFGSSSITIQIVFSYSIIMFYCLFVYTVSSGVKKKLCTV